MDQFDPELGTVEASEPKAHVVCHEETDDPLGPQKGPSPTDTLNQPLVNALADPKLCTRDTWIIGDQAVVVGPTDRRGIARLQLDALVSEAHCKLAQHFSSFVIETKWLVSAGRGGSGGRR